MAKKSLKTLYEIPLGATRSGPLYHAHWYPTKISPDSIALMIACHTKPGNMVFDGFGGSCTTALASLEVLKTKIRQKSEKSSKDLCLIMSCLHNISYRT